MLVSSLEQARQWQQAGALLLVYSSDVEMLHSGFSQAMARLVAK
jgi:2-dehydro-3-deoxyglucarate aldolase/4-hydroxy-2-oxoheptanedioate aldolase